MKNLYMSENFEEAWNRLNESLSNVFDLAKYAFYDMRYPADVFKRSSKAFAEKKKQEASKAFWAAAKQNQIDVKNFWLAFVLSPQPFGGFSSNYSPDWGNKVFNEEGLFNSKGIYGRIKEHLNANQQDWTARAFLKLWTLQFKDNGTIINPLSDLEAEAANNKKVVEQAEADARAVKEKADAELKQKMSQERRARYNKENAELRAAAEEMTKVIPDIQKEADKIINDWYANKAKEINELFKKNKEYLDKLADEKDVDLDLLGTAGGYDSDMYVYPYYSITKVNNADVKVIQASADNYQPLRGVLFKKQAEYARYHNYLRNYSFEVDEDEAAWDGYNLFDVAVIVWQLPYEFYDNVNKKIHIINDSERERGCSISYEDYKAGKLKEIIEKDLTDTAQYLYYSFLRNNEYHYNKVENEIERQSLINDKVNIALAAQEAVNNGDSADAKDFENFIMQRLEEGYNAAWAAYRSWQGTTDGSDGAAYHSEFLETKASLEPFLTSCNWKATYKDKDDEVAEVTYDISMGTKGFDNLFGKIFTKLLDFKVLPTSKDIF